MQEAIFVLYRSRKPTRRHLKRRENTLTMQASTKDVEHCNKSTEDIYHILGSCEALSASLYLPVRHNEVVKVIYNTLIKIYHPDEKYIRPCNIWRGENAELWWDYSIKTTPQVKHNKPDIVLWVPSSMKCCH